MMTKFFEGRRKVGETSQLVEDGRARVDCQIFEEWEDIDLSTTARCGQDCTCIVEKVTGISEKGSYTLKGVIENTIGVKDVLSLKAQIEEAIGREVNWNKEVKTTQTFSYKSPSCGRCTMTIYQLARIYELVYLRKKWFTWGENIWHKKWTRTIRESTNNHDALPDFEQIDDTCKCQNALEPPKFDGQLVFDFGNISFRAPYRLTEHGFEVQIIDNVATFSTTELSELSRGLEYGVTAIIPVDIIPKPLIYLGDIEASELEVHIQKITNDYLSDEVNEIDIREFTIERASIDLQAMQPLKADDAVVQDFQVS
jgi:hypothetical protein